MQWVARFLNFFDLSSAVSKMVFIFIILVFFVNSWADAKRGTERKGLSGVQCKKTVLSYLIETLLNLRKKIPRLRWFLFLFFKNLWNWWISPKILQSSAGFLGLQPSRQGQLKARRSNIIRRKIQKSQGHKTHRDLKFQKYHYIFFSKLSILSFRGTLRPPYICWAARAAPTFSAFFSKW